MSKLQKEESFDQQSESNKRHNRGLAIQSRKRKDSKNRQITHYFSKAEKLESGSNKNKNLPTPDKIVIEEMDLRYNLLIEKQTVLQAQIQELKLLKEREKQQEQAYLARSKALICQQLKKLSYFNRKLKQQIQIDCGYIDEESGKFCYGPQITRLQTLISNKTKYLQKNKDLIDEAHSYFLQKQINNHIKCLQSLKNSAQLYRDRLKTAIEQKSCYFFQQKWPCIQKKYQILQLIGKGGFSEVYKAFNLIDNSYVAIKLSSIDSLGHSSVSQNYLKLMRRQFQIHRNLQHKNIVKLIQVIQMQKQVICFVLEYCEGKPLSMHLKCQQINQKQAKMIIKQIAGVIKYLSQQTPSIIHYDLKPQNIIFHNGVIKVLDFGISKIIDSEHSRIALTSQGVGSFWYLPPESFQSQATITNKVDIWSMGVIFYELIFNKKPYSAVELNSKNNKQILTFPIDKNISCLGKQFLKGCLAIQERQRFDAHKAFYHEYLNE